jgi:hypothetical protein
VIALLLACAGADPLPESSGAAAADYVGEPGRVLEFIPVGEPDAEGVSLSLLDGTWSFGDVASYTARLAPDGFYVDEGLVLPDRLAVGTTGEGVVVTAVGSVETWYGTFPDAVTVSIDAGPLAGEAEFARDVGPVRLVWEGWDGELAGYE